MSTTLSYDSSSKCIKINKKELPISSFWFIDDDSKVKTVGDGDVNESKFVKQQAMMRMVDILKDGTTGAKRLAVSNIKGIMATDLPGFVEAIRNIGYGDWKEGYLDPMEEQMATFMEHRNQVKKMAWTNICNASHLDPLMKSRKVFQETGISAEYFIENPTFVVNFANVVIDPFKRKKDNKNEYFPYNSELVVDPLFFELFSFPHFSLSSRGEKQYRITYRGITINESTSTHYLKGNNQIHQFINSNKFPNDTKQLVVEQKQLLLLLKEMGDVLQVLLMMVWSTMNPTTDYTMITCDKVVFLLCMVLNLNCSLSYKNHKNNTRCIEMFEGKTYDSTTATSRFNKVKESIMHDNAQFIEAIVSLKKGRGYICIDGHSDDSAKPLPDEFYDNVMEDTTMINDALQNFKLPNNATPAEIDQQIERMKSNFTINLFFRKSSKKVCILHTKSYTKNKDVVERKNLKLHFRDTNVSMYQYLQSVEKNLPSEKKRSSASLEYNVQPLKRRRRTPMTTPTQTRVQGGRSKKKRTTRRRRRLRGGNQHVVQQHLLLPTGAMYQDSPMDLFVTPEKWHANAEDWYVELIDEVTKGIGRKYKEYFIHIYSQLLYSFYLENGVAYGDDLVDKIRKIEEEIELGTNADNEMVVDIEPPGSQPPGYQSPEALQATGSQQYSQFPESQGHWSTATLFNYSNTEDTNGTKSNKQLRYP